MNKKWVWGMLTAGVFALATVVAGFLYTAHHPVAIRIHGIQYHNGLDLRTRPVTVTLDGYWYRTLLGRRVFHGTIDIAHASTINPDNHRPLTVAFLSDGLGWLTWGFFHNGQPHTFAYGALFAGPSFHQIAIIETTSDGWDARHGLTIAGPATNRRVALKISSRLMTRFLRGFPLR